MARAPKTRSEHESFTLSIMMCLAVMYNLVSIPIRISFDMPLLGPWIIFDILADAVFVCDFLYGWGLKNDPGVRVRYSAYQHDRSTKDGIAAIPMDHFILAFGLGTLSPIWVPILRLNRLLRSDYLFNALRRLKRMQPHNAPMFRMVRLMLLVAIISHCYACAWHLLGEQQGVNQGTWLHDQELINEDLPTQYLHCIYWAITTITTVGYGDITPHTNAEILFTLVVMVTGVLLWAYVIGTMSWMVSNLDYVGTEYRQKLNQVSQFLQHNNVSKELREGIHEYYDYLWSHHLIGGRDEVLGDLPESLRIQVAMELNKDLVSSVPFLQGCDPGFMESLVTLLKPQAYCPGDIVIHRGTLGKEMYFIRTGELEIIGENGEVIKVCQPGSFIGEMAMLFSQSRSATVRAKSYAELYMLTKDDFEEVLGNFPVFAEKVRAIGQRRSKQTADEPRDPAAQPSKSDKLPIQAPDSSKDRSPSQS